MPFPQITNGALILAALFAAFTAIRMARSGLHARYRSLFAYFIFLIPYSAWPLMFDVKSHAYYHIWLASEPLNWIFQIVVVRELCGLVLERYKGLCTLGRWGMYAGITISAGVSLATLLPRIQTDMTQRSHVLYYMVGANRGINLALAIFLLLMMVLVSRYPVPLSRNVITNAMIYTILFFCNSMAALLHTIFDLKISTPVDAVLTSLGTVALAAWFFLLTPRGEEIHVELAHLQPDKEERALRYLDELNQLVLNMGRS